jgi:hypothetical protein
MAEVVHDTGESVYVFLGCVRVCVMQNPVLLHLSAPMVDSLAVTRLVRWFYLQTL